MSLFMCIDGCVGIIHWLHLFRNASAVALFRAYERLHRLLLYVLV